MKNVILISLSICLFISINLLSPTEVLNFPTFSKEVEQYEPQFSELKIKSQYINPFDVNDIRIDNSLSGENAIQPGFFDGEQNDVSFWAVRFAPLKIDNYSYQFRIYTHNNTIISKTISFQVIPSRRNSFLHLNPESDYTFKLDSGQLFRAFGENVCWTDNYEYYFKA